MQCIHYSSFHDRNDQWLLFDGVRPSFLCCVLFQWVLVSVVGAAARSGKSLMLWLGLMLETVIGDLPFSSRVSRLEICPALSSLVYKFCSRDVNVWGLFSKNRLRRWFPRSLCNIIYSEPVSMEMLDFWAHKNEVECNL